MDVDWREHLRGVDVDGTPLNVVDIGSGPTVVFLHGLAGCRQNWLENIPAFASDHRVVAIDLPGSAPRRCPPSPSRWRLRGGGVRHPLPRALAK